jgi:hypothetical protein
MTYDIEMQLRALTPEQFGFVTRAMLEAIENNTEAAATEAELDQAAKRDEADVREAAASLGITGTDHATAGTDQVALVSAVADMSPEAAAALHAALTRVSQPDVQLPLLGLGGVEFVLIAIAAAIVRPKIEFTRKEQKSGAGESHLRLSLEGTPHLDRVIRAAVSLLPRI